MATDNPTADAQLYVQSLNHASQQPAVSPPQSDMVLHQQPHQNHAPAQPPAPQIPPFAWGNTFMQTSTPQAPPPSHLQAFPGSSEFAPGADVVMAQPNHPPVQGAYASSLPNLSPSSGYIIGTNAGVVLNPPPQFHYPPQSLPASGPANSAPTQNLLQQSYYPSAQGAYASSAPNPSPLRYIVGPNAGMVLNPPPQFHYPRKAFLLVHMPLLLQTLLPLAATLLDPMGHGAEPTTTIPLSPQSLPAGGPAYSAPAQNLPLQTYHPLAQGAYASFPPSGSYIIGTSMGVASNPPLQLYPSPQGSYAPPPQSLPAGGPTHSTPAQNLPLQTYHPPAQVAYASFPPSGSYIIGTNMGVASNPPLQLYYPSPQGSYAPPPQSLPAGGPTHSTPTQNLPQQSYCPPVQAAYAPPPNFAPSIGNIALAFGADPAVAPNQLSQPSYSPTQASYAPPSQGPIPSAHSSPHTSLLPGYLAVNTPFTSTGPSRQPEDPSFGYHDQDNAASWSYGPESNVTTNNVLLLEQQLLTMPALPLPMLRSRSAASVSTWSRRKGSSDVSWRSTPYPPKKPKAKDFKEAMQSALILTKLDFVRECFRRGTVFPSIPNLLKDFQDLADVLFMKNGANFPMPLTRTDKNFKNFVDALAIERGLLASLARDMVPQILGYLRRTCDLAQKDFLTLSKEHVTSFPKLFEDKLGKPMPPTIKPKVMAFTYSHDDDEDEPDEPLNDKGKHREVKPSNPADRWNNCTCHNLLMRFLMEKEDALARKQPYSFRPPVLINLVPTTLSAGSEKEKSVNFTKKFASDSAFFKQQIDADMANPETAANVWKNLEMWWIYGCKQYGVSDEHPVSSTNSAIEAHLVSDVATAIAQERNAGSAIEDASSNLQLGPQLEGFGMEEQNTFEGPSQTAPNNNPDGWDIIPSSVIELVSHSFTMPGSMERNLLPSKTLISHDKQDMTMSVN
ncbi:hypothetical protein CPB84DRAFT_1856656 [Gymnopilus junonius]|uniref:Uncharacterized protein n=1 Tax=Gymnopilus junonius TaxID=109634 RepID=A0A9P5TFE5_GYMJU|nr:hypothetical protein CPB84DRAFT_1856656 [Gymnopilus junonius]